MKWNLVCTLTTFTMYTDSELPSAFAFIDYHAMTTTFVKNYNLVLIQHFIKQTKLYI